MNSKFKEVYSGATSKDLETMEQHLLDAINGYALEGNKDKILELKEEVEYIQSLLYGATTAVFPNDFSEREHPNVPGATQWRYPKYLADGEITMISIVGGGYGLNGDGVRTFEMFDFREEDTRGYMTKEEINDHLSANPFVKERSCSDSKEDISPEEKYKITLNGDMANQFNESQEDYENDLDDYYDHLGI